MGVFEMEKFAKGTNDVAKTLAECTSKGAITVSLPMCVLPRVFVCVCVCARARRVEAPVRTHLPLTLVSLCVCGRIYP